MSNDQNASAAQRTLTKREKIINAIPLAIVLVIAVYFAYSCRHSQEVASATNAFVTRYQDLNNDFNQQLRRFLDGEMSPADYRAHLQTTGLKALTDLQRDFKALPEESRAAISCLKEAEELLERKIELSQTIIDAPGGDVDTETLIPRLKTINDLQNAIHAAATATN